MVPSSIREPRAVISLLDYLMDRVLLSILSYPTAHVLLVLLLLLLLLLLDIIKMINKKIK